MITRFHTEWALKKRFYKWHVEKAVEIDIKQQALRQPTSPEKS